MLTALIIIFIIAYAAIALEHPIKINKSASALMGAGLLWTIYALSLGDPHTVNEQLGHSLMGTAQIVFFLIGDVTTTMLWIGGQITAPAIIKSVILPSLVSMIAPLSITAYALRGREVEARQQIPSDHGMRTTEFERNLMFFTGLGVLVAVPVFKTVTHLPPFMGVMFGLGILWLVGDLVHRHKEEAAKHHLTPAHALSKIDMS